MWNLTQDAGLWPPGCHILIREFLLMLPRLHPGRGLAMQAKNRNNYVNSKTTLLFAVGPKTLVHCDKYKGVILPMFFCRVTVTIISHYFWIPMNPSVTDGNIEFQAFEPCGYITCSPSKLPVWAAKLRCCRGFFANGPMIWCPNPPWMHKWRVG